MKRIFLIVIKWIPFIMSLLIVLNLIFDLIGIPTIVFSILGDSSLITVLFILLASFLFQFCVYHRLFIYYILLYDIISWLDYIFIFDLNSKLFISISIIIFVIICIVALYLHIKDNEQVKIIKRNNAKYNR
jgi:hypothetical protein